ncbi:hypothetical protein CEXT_733461 [Caerostris extrusa]|uniref:Uncharacterized protein n=1 Tax=Caerostris extrusa TaxID=172846 RepID=A0AAV4NHN1_CAEEX|nr:hypothetical protein CEXT_733461 [Caerostris extrusa]
MYKGTTERGIHSVLYKSKFLERFQGVRSVTSIYFCFGSATVVAYNILLRFKDRYFCPLIFTTPSPDLQQSLPFIPPTSAGIQWGGRAILQSFHLLGREGGCPSHVTSGQARISEGCREGEGRG